MRGIRRFIRFAWSLLTTTAILTGSAYLLVRWAGWPLPDHIPTADETLAFLNNPHTPAALKAIAACVAWLLWLSLLAAVILQLWPQRSRGTTRRLLPRPLRIATAGLVGVGVLNLANPASAHDASTDAAAVTSGHGGPQPSATAAMPSIDAASSSASAGPADPDDRPGTHEADGVDIPGGWVTWPLANGILASSAAALLGGTHPRSASNLIRKLRATQHPEVDPAEATDEPGAVDDVALLEHDAATPTMLTVAALGQNLSLDVLPRSGVGFTGPGADDAMRGLLAITAVTANPGIVVITQNLLSRLTSTNLSLPNVMTAQDTAQAVHLIQLEVGTRYADTTKPDAAHPRAPMLLIIEPPTDDAQVKAIATLGHPLGIYAVIQGPWATGVTWQVDHRGYASDGDTAIGRLNKVSRRSLQELAQLLAQPPAVTQPTFPQASADAPAPPLRLCILGKPRLITPSPHAPLIRRSGSWQIATYLALHPHGASRSDLIEEVFGHMKSLDAAMTSLNTCLHELRRGLSVDGTSALITTDGGYRLDHHQVDVDWWQLQTHLQHGRLAAAVSLYEGSVAEGYRWDWLPEHRQTARRTVADAYALLATSAEAPNDALNFALAGITVDPYAQDCYAAAIGAHLQAGNRNGAEMILRDLRQRLSRSKIDLSPAVQNVMP